ncbi:MAG: DUF480 domain-containing protein [Planctomycetaceae bacterium]|jgi:uncharacterized protein YceH (UPF0502 family)|nr:DUF480 domain-containing protein [Planctomycetaceae bacterium]
MIDEFENDQRPEVRELSSRQRRVLGVLIEKGLTTPEYYPLTLKAVMTGCNQKSNRSPVVDYDEDAVEETLDQLKELGLVGVLHPDSGRSLRYRHYVRKRYEFSEPQIAILGELLCRGRQTLGELRGRASRMVPIETLELLRSELNDLLTRGYIQASGSLERRGVEVDHAFYRSNENRGGMTTMPAEAVPASASSAISTATRDVAAPASVAPSLDDDKVNALETQISDLRSQNQELKDEVERLRTTVYGLESKVEDICRDLGI